MTDYEPPDPAAAERVYRQQLADVELRSRLLGASGEELRRLAGDANEPALVRVSALARLAYSDDGVPAMLAAWESSDILLALLADPDAETRQLALERSPHVWFPFWSDPRVVQRARQLLDDPDVGVHAAAAHALAKRRDAAVLPHLLGWLRGDQPHRNLAAACLRWLGSPEALHALREAWDQGGRGEEDRMALAAALLWAGDRCVAPFLTEVARRCSGVWSGFAAATLYGAPAFRGEGLRLMRRVLDHGDMEAKRWMVGQISSFSGPGLMHAFTADGIHDARCWVDQRLEQV